MKISDLVIIVLVLILIILISINIKAYIVRNNLLEKETINLKKEYFKWEESESMEKYN